MLKFCGCRYIAVFCLWKDDTELQVWKVRGRKSEEECGGERKRVKESGREWKRVEESGREWKRVEESGREQTRAKESKI